MASPPIRMKQTKSLIIYHISPRLMHTHVFVHIIHGIIIPVVGNHYTHV